MRRIKNEGYQPLQSEMVEVAKEFKISVYSPDLVADIAAIIEGGWSLSHDLTPKQVPEFEPDSDGDYRLTSGGWSRDLQEKVEDWKKEQASLQKQTQSFLIDNISLWEQTPGDSPLRAAMAAIKKLSQITPDQGQEDSDGTSIPLPSSDKCKKAAQTYQESLEVLEKLKPEDYEYLEVEEGDKETAFIKMTQAEKVLFQVDQFLESKTQLKVKPKSRLVQDPEGTIEVYRRSRELSDLPKANKKILMSRNLGQSILAGKGKVPVQYRRDTPTPLIGVMVDNSGSMNENQKNLKAYGVVYHLLKKARKGDCHLIISSFITNISNFQYVEAGSKTPKEVLNKFKLSFNGNTTRVGNCSLEFLKKTEGLIEDQELSVDPKQTHFLIINDGQDDATSLTAAELKSTTLHGLILESKNEHIRKLANATGGLYLEAL